MNDVVVPIEYRGRKLCRQWIALLQKMFKEHSMLEAIINENIQWKETARQKNIFVRLNSCMIYLHKYVLLLQYVYTISFVFLCSW